VLIGIDASRAITTQRTGTEAYAYFLIRHLLPLAARRGHRVRLYFHRPVPAGMFPQTEQIEHIVLPFPRLWTHVRLGWELRRRSPDVFFTPAHVIPYGYKGASVATIHDVGYRHFPAAHPPRQLKYLEWSTRHNATVSRHVIADSAATRRDLAAFYAIPPAKVTVVYPGIDPLLARVRDGAKLTAVCHKYNITPPYFLFISTLQPRKNLERLVQAYAQSGAAPQLVLAGGTGWLAEPIMVEIGRQRAAGHNIITPGFVADRDKAALLSGAMALLYPSLHEGFGFPLLEAQACGTPVLASTTSSLPEVAGDSALLVDPLDVAGMATAIGRLATDPLLRAELTDLGAVNVKRFGWWETAVGVLDVLEKAGRETVNN
jgi:glycosyltransferase involved in cell wall biosynthesis